MYATRKSKRIPSSRSADRLVRIQTIRILDALAAGLPPLIAKLSPASTTRFEAFLFQVRKTYLWGSTRNREAADAKLVVQLSQFRLPDRRIGKSLQDDGRIVREYFFLTEQLAPVFRQQRFPDERNKQAAPIVSRITGRNLQPKDLPQGKISLANFCYGVLHTSAADLTRRRRRFRSHVVESLKVARAHLDLVARDPRTPEAVRTGLRNQIEAFHAQRNRLFPRSRQ